MPEFRLGGAGGEGDDRGWDGWMSSPTRWTWVCVSSRSWWWRGKPGVVQSMGSQRVGHNWETELNWTEFRWWELHTSNSHRETSNRRCMRDNLVIIFSSVLLLRSTEDETVNGSRLQHEWFKLTIRKISLNGNGC